MRRGPQWEPLLLESLSTSQYDPVEAIAHSILDFCMMILLELLYDKIMTE